MARAVMARACSRSRSVSVMEIWFVVAMNGIFHKPTLLSTLLVHEFFLSLFRVKECCLVPLRVWVWV